MRQIKTHFGLILLGLYVLVRRREERIGRKKEEEEEGGGEEDQTKVCFSS